MNKSPHILLIQESTIGLERLKKALEQEGYQPIFECVGSINALQKALETQKWDVLMGHDAFSALPGLEALKWVRTRDDSVPFVMVYNPADPHAGLEATKAGATYCLPENNPEWLALVIQQELETAYLNQAGAQTEKSLQRQRALTDCCMDAADVMIILINEHHEVLLINKKGCNILGYTEQEVLGKNWIQNFVPPKSQETVTVVFDKLLQKQTESVIYFETPVLTKSGQEKTIGWHNTVLIGEDDDLKVIFSSGKDISEVEIIHQRKETFVATLTHDLNTPIRAASQVLSLLLSGNFGSLTDEQKEVLTEILHSNQFMQRMVESLLTIYKYEDHQVELHLEQTDLNDLITYTLTGELQDLAEEKNQVLAFQIHPELSKVTVDPEEIRRVLSNLIQNAILFSPEGATVTISTEPQDHQICVSVEDTGRGIEPEILKTLFNQYSSIVKRFRQVGTGLSLYLSRQIIEAHGGRIGVESKVGQGSRFFFTLPIKVNSTKQPLTKLR